MHLGQASPSWDAASVSPPALPLHMSRACTRSNDTGCTVRGTGLGLDPNDPGQARDGDELCGSGQHHLANVGSELVGAENTDTSRNLQILVYQAPRRPRRTGRTGVPQGGGLCDRRGRCVLSQLRHEEGSRGRSRTDGRRSGTTGWPGCSGVNRSFSTYFWTSFTVAASMVSSLSRTVSEALPRARPPLVLALSCLGCRVRHAARRHGRPRHGTPPDGTPPGGTEDARRGPTGRHARRRPGVDGQGAPARLGPPAGSPRSARSRSLPGSHVAPGPSAVTEAPTSSRPTTARPTGRCRAE